MERRKETVTCRKETVKTDVGKGGRDREHVDVSSVHTEQYLAERDNIIKYIASVYIKINGQVTSLRKTPHAITIVWQGQILLALKL